jgi:drug/metabolite transporter (DMT)-like permease
MWLILLNYFLWSSVFPIGKSALSVSPPIFLTAVRMLFAAALLLVYLGIKSRGSFKLSWRQIGALALFGFLGVYLTNVLEFWSLTSLPAAKVCFLYSLSPFLAALLSYFHFNEKMTWRKWVGMALGFVAMLPVLMQQSGSESLMSAFGFISWPDLAMFGAVFASVYGWILLRISLKEHKVSTLMANAGGMLLGGLMALVHSSLVDSWSPFPVSNWPLFTQGVVLMTLISNIICFNIYGYLLKKYTMTLLSFAGLLSPIFASLTSWLLLGEPISWVLISCTGIILFALYIVYSEELKLGYVNKKDRLAKKRAKENKWIADNEEVKLAYEAPSATSSKKANSNSK